MPFEFAFLDWLQQFHNRCWMRWPSFSTTPVSTVRSGSRSHCFCCCSAAPARPGAPWPRRWYCIWWPGTASSSRCSPGPAPATVEHGDHHSGQASPRALLPLRAHGLGFLRQPLRSGCKTGSWASPRWCWRLSSPLPDCTCMCTFPPMCWAAWRWALHWVSSPRGSLTAWQTSLRENKSYNVKTPSAGAETAPMEGVFICFVGHTLRYRPTTALPCEGRKRRTAASFSCVMQRLFFCRWDLAFLPVAGAYFLASARLPSA